MMPERAAASGILGVDRHVRAHLEAVSGVGHGLHGAGLDRVPAGQARLLGRDGEAGDVDEATGGTGLRPEVVLHRARAHDGEVGLAGLGHDRLVLVDCRVVQVELELLAVDAPGGVAPLDEGGAGVEDLLVEPGTALEAGVGHGAQRDGVGGDALRLLGSRGRQLPAALVGPAHPFEVTEVARPATGGPGGLGGLGRCGVGGVLAPISTTAGGHQRPDGDHGEQDATSLHWFPRCGPDPPVGRLDHYRADRARLSVDPRGIAP